MDWQEITVKTTQELVDAVSESFYDLGAGGVVIEDPSVYKGYIEAGEWDYYDIPEELLSREYIVVKGYLPINEELLLKEEELKNRLAQMSRLFPCTTMEISFAKVKEEDWEHSWKAYYKPHKVGSIVVKPSWEDYKASNNEIIIELDPGMAFGTGTHPTTEMVLDLLQKHMRVGGTVIDVGTGTGVLAIAAAKLNAGKVFALDIDSVAVQSASENISSNNVQNIVEVQKNDLLKDFTLRANIIIANIVADVIIRLFEQLDEVLSPGGILLASGIIKDRLQDVLKAAEAHGLEVIDNKISGEWVALCLKR